MPWAIFHKRYDHDFRPLKNVCQCIDPLPGPQQWPRDVIDAAIAAGKATETNSPTADDKRAATGAGEATKG